MQEIEREIQREEKHSDDHDNGDAWKDSNILSCSACADHVIPCNRRDYARYHARSGIVDVSGSGRWCSHRAVSRNHWCCHWRSRRALSPSYSKFWIFHLFWIFHFVSNFSSCYQAVSMRHCFSLQPFWAHFCTAKSSFGVWFLHDIIQQTKKVHVLRMELCHMELPKYS